MSEPVNILVAYPYLDARMVEALRGHDADVRLLVDSGAFTAWKAGKTIALDDYCRFLESLPIRPWRYFMLDVIGDPEATMANYETMRRRGFTPVPVFTRGEDPSVLEHYYQTSDVVGIGGLVKTAGNKGFVNGIMKQVGDRKVHWLGFASLPFLKTYRPYSCDATTWINGYKYMYLELYLGRGQWARVSRADMVKRPDQKILDAIRRYGADPFVLTSPEAWKNGSSNGPKPAQVVTSTAWVVFQRDVKKNLGTHLFLPCSNVWEVDFLMRARDRLEGST